MSQYFRKQTTDDINVYDILQGISLASVLCGCESQRRALLIAVHTKALFLYFYHQDMMRDYRSAANHICNLTFKPTLRHYKKESVKVELIKSIELRNLLVPRAAEVAATELRVVCCDPPVFAYVLPASLCVVEGSQPRLGVRRLGWYHWS